MDVKIISIAGPPPPVNNKTPSPHSHGSSPLDCLLPLFPPDSLQGSFMISPHTMLDPLSGLDLRIPQPPLTPPHRGYCPCATSSERVLFSHHSSGSSVISQPLQCLMRLLLTSEHFRCSACSPSQWKHWEGKDSPLRHYTPEPLVPDQYPVHRRYSMVIK